MGNLRFTERREEGSHKFNRTSGKAKQKKEIL